MKGHHLNANKTLYSKIYFVSYQPHHPNPSSAGIVWEGLFALVSLFCYNILMNKLAVTSNQLLKGFNRSKLIRLKRPELIKTIYGGVTPPAMFTRGTLSPSGINKKIAPTLPNPGFVKPSLGKIVTEKGQNPSQILLEAIGQKTAPGYGKKMLNATVLRHEADEVASKVVDHSFVKAYGHINAGVILKEHNIIKALEGKGAKQVKQIFTHLRTRPGAENSTIQKSLKDLNFDYGKSPRLSRHAIKRITNIIKDKTL
jgi:hypothetical protein